jgi:hypothetical protein
VKEDKPEFVGLVIYILSGATRTVPGTSKNRVVEDIKRAHEIWGFSILPVKVIEIKDTDYGISRVKLSCDEAFINTDTFQAMNLRRMKDGFPAEWITVWYVPNHIFSNRNTIACACANLLTDSSQFQHIIMSGRTAAPENRSTLAHELGHIFFGTVPGENNSDPTARNNPHSPIRNNFMSTPAGDKTAIDIRQIEKACRSRLVPPCKPALYKKKKGRRG